MSQAKAWSTSLRMTRYDEAHRPGRRYLHHHLHHSGRDRSPRRLAPTMTTCHTTLDRLTSPPMGGAPRGPLVSYYGPCWDRTSPRQPRQPAGRFVSRRAERSRSPLWTARYTAPLGAVRSRSASPAWVQRATLPGPTWNQSDPDHQTVDEIHHAMAHHDTWCGHVLARPAITRARRASSGRGCSTVLNAPSWGSLSYQSTAKCLIALHIQLHIIYLIRGPGLATPSRIATDLGGPDRLRVANPTEYLKKSGKIGGQYLQEGGETSDERHDR